MKQANDPGKVVVVRGLDQPCGAPAQDGGRFFLEREKLADLDVQAMRELLDGVDGRRLAGRLHGLDKLVVQPRLLGQSFERKVLAEPDLPDSLAESNA